MSLRTLFLIALVATLLYGRWMSSSVKPLTTGEVVAFELARTPAAADALLRDWGPEKTALMEKDTYLDFGYIALYMVAFFAGCRYAGRSSNHARWDYAGRLASVAALIAGSCDIIENVAILNALGGAPTMAATATAFACALVKFALLALLLLFVLAAFFRKVILSLRRG